MTTISHYQPKRSSPGAFAMVIALHAAGIAALLMWKISVPPHYDGTIRIFPIHETVDPPPIPPEQTPDRPAQRSVIKTVASEVPIPVDGADVPTVDWVPPRDPPLTLGDGIVAPPQPPMPRIEQSARARGDVRQLFSGDDYPAAAIRRNETGSVRARLAIGTDGTVTGCSIVESSGSATLDRATCNVLKGRARFTPARDSSGRAASDSYLTPAIVWKLVDQG